MSNDLRHYDYALPDELIARTPPPHREDARLMIVDRTRQTIRHSGIRHLATELRSGDCLVLNNSRVVPARLFGHRTATGARWEGLFLAASGEGTWQLMGQTRGRLHAGEIIEIYPAHQPESHERLRLTLLEKADDGIWTVRPDADENPYVLLDRFGSIPLPPYMERALADAADYERYQTIYAVRPGSVAAPTAGLHLTAELLAECQARGIGRAFVTLHVGVGTFRPIGTTNLDDHRMHSERCEITAETVATLERVRESGGRIVAVGTTSARTLETAARGGQLAAFEGSTDLFIRPPYPFRAVDVLLTNFHLPKSTLLVMVAALAGRDLILEAYREAIASGYRFYSYGDAMLIV